MQKRRVVESHRHHFFITFNDMSDYKLDRNAFRAHSLKEASEHSSYYKHLTWLERLSVAYYLNSVAYGFDKSNPPRIDKSKFSARSLKK